MKFNFLLRVFLFVSFWGSIYMDCNAQKVTIPKTPEIFWAGVSFDIQDNKEKTAIPAKYVLIDSIDSTIAAKGYTEYTRWNSDDGEHEKETIMIILPDYRKKYLLEIIADGYMKTVIELDYSKKVLPESDLKAREFKEGPISLISNKYYEQN